MATFYFLREKDYPNKGTGFFYSNPVFVSVKIKNLNNQGHYQFSSFHVFDNFASFISE